MPSLTHNGNPCSGSGVRTRDSDLGRQLLRRVNEKQPNLLHIWIAALLAGVGVVIGVIRARAFLRRGATSLTVPVQPMEPDLAETLGSP